tara:strand:+ start:970 stop:1785 length:816 start_codon:yes stop_codon:yes gene_type:complete
MKIIIAGSTGFIGTSLVNDLKKTFSKVVSLTREQISDIIQSQSEENFSDGDVLIYLAESNDRNFVNSQSLTYKEEALDRLNSFIMQGFEKIIYASSVTLYSDKDATPKTEEHSVSSRDLYSELKIESENIILENNGIVLRLSNVYGKGMSKINVLSDIIRQMNHDEVHLISLNPVRDFIWIDDVVNAFKKSIDYEGSGVFNIALGSSLSIGDLASILLEESGNIGCTITTKNHYEEFSKVIIDINKAKNSLKWNPKITITQGIGILLNEEI